MKLALYPGSFDPITNGHVNMIRRGLDLFDTLIVGVANNVRKTAMFSAEERVSMIHEAIGDAPNLQVEAFSGLLVQYAQERGVSVVLRGLRAVSDFEFEFQMAHMNRRLGSGLETVFMMTGEEHFYVSSQIVREVAAFGGDVSGLVPPHVATRLLERFQKKA